jgi:hypothetical protein
MSLWSRERFIAVRVFATHGQYPEFAIRTAAHRYEASAELVWTAVIQEPLPSDWEIGEFTLFTPEEIRLLAAVALSEPQPWENGLPIIARGVGKHVQLQLGADGLLDEAVSRQLRAIVAELAIEVAGHKPAAGSRDLITVRKLGLEADALDLLQATDSSDQLLLAGLARYLGASRVLLIAHEPEEGAILLYVSMGAALEFLRGHIAAERGVPEVPYAEVGNYLRRTFRHGDEMAEYFETRHEERVIAIHPANRYGEFWAPPLMMGDVYHLQKSLIGIYRHIVLGEVVQD